MRVSNIIGSKGNKVVNQFIIDDDNYRYFQSYNSTIVKIDKWADRIYLDEVYWNYSRTTSKYRNIFLGETTEETKKKIASGEYLLVNLN